jgi:hypothetical protein
MQLLFRLPFVLLEMALRRGLRSLLALAGRAQDDEFDPGDVVAPAPAAPPEPQSTPRAPAAPPPPTAEEAIARRVAREAESANGASSSAPPPAPSRPRPIRTAPHVDREAEVVESVGPADDVVATIDVDEPWDGYDGMAASAVVARLRGADPATKGVVRLYEQRHKRRATVLRATA